jgi:hypothetical protein
MEKETGVPKFFQRGDKPIASYDWVDFVGGVGYKKFYGACSVNSTGLSYFLTPKLIDSSSRANAAPYDGVKTRSVGVGDNVNVTFDITFNVPSIIGGGMAYAQATVEISSNTVRLTTTIQLYHVKGAVETLIGTASTEVLQHSAGTFFRVCLMLPTTTTKFAIGDKLRIKAGLVNTAATGYVTLFHDPTSYLSYDEPAPYARKIGTDFWVDVPFKIDI